MSVAYPSHFILSNKHLAVPVCVSVDMWKIWLNYNCHCPDHKPSMSGVIRGALNVWSQLQLKQHFLKATFFFLHPKSEDCLHLMCFHNPLLLCCSSLLKMCGFYLKSLYKKHILFVIFSGLNEQTRGYQSLIRNSWHKTLTYVFTLLSLLLAINKLLL